MSIKAFRIALTLDVKIVWFGWQVAVCVQKRHKMQFLVVVGFKSSTLTVYCLSSWFVHQQRKTYSNLCVLCWLSHWTWFQGPKDIPPLFWPWVTNHDFKSKISKKWFQRSLFFFTQIFHDGEKLRRKPKIFVKVIQRFWYVQHAVLTYFKSTRSCQSSNFGKILQCWKNLGMFPSSRFWYTISFNCV